MNLVTCGLGVGTVICTDRIAFEMKNVRIPFEKKQAKISFKSKPIRYKFSQRIVQ